MASIVACPYDFFDSSLVFNVLSKIGIRFCPYVFPKC